MKLTYRPEIDGLRAIAVISVVIYHARFLLEEKFFLKGGFIGVDIFFVISGYLITSLIYKEYLKEKKFSYINFYQRRIRRILPALIFVISLSSCVAYIYLLPTALKDFANSSLSSIFFASNIFFWNTSVEYSATSELFRPLLHTWSLSIEEQFYLFFPVIFIFLLKKFEKNLLIIILFVFCISLLFSNYGNTNFQSLNFYIIFSRGWELLAGSIISIIEIKYNRNLYLNKFLSNALSLLGLVCEDHVPSGV